MRVVVEIALGVEVLVGATQDEGDGVEFCVGCLMLLVVKCGLRLQPYSAPDMPLNAAQLPSLDQFVDLMRTTRP